MREKFYEIFQNWLTDEDNADFSGVFSVTGSDGVILQQAQGYRNRAEELPNTVDTSFAIASGTKLFTGLAVCKLIDEKKLSLQDKLHDLLPFELGQIKKNVTVFHLLTHTSGVGDYVDEDAEDFDAQMRELRDTYPAHLWTRLEYYLQMITPLPAKFEPGAEYGYSNSGFILLGLVVEAISGIAFQQYVHDNIFVPCGMGRTGFYRMDCLPANTALGYVQYEDTGEWRTNIFSMPIVGGSDGGLFTNAADMDKLWRALFANKILSATMLEQFLAYQVEIDDEDGESYGLGVYRNMEDGNVSYYAVGFDAGIVFITGYFPKTQVVVTALGNTEVNTFPLLNEAFEVLD